MMEESEMMLYMGALSCDALGPIRFSAINDFNDNTKHSRCQAGLNTGTAEEASNVDFSAALQGRLSPLPWLWTLESWVAYPSKPYDKAMRRQVGVRQT
jgi:hypothetical protein